LDDLFVTWTTLNEDGTKYIEIIKYNCLSGDVSTETRVSDLEDRADYSDVLANVGDKIVVVWHSNLSGRYEIFASVLNPDLNTFGTDRFLLTNGNGGSRYPVLSEQQLTGNVYVVWQDYKEGIGRGDIEYMPSNAGDDPSADPYSPAPVLFPEARENTIFVAVYDNLEERFLPTGDDVFDVSLRFTDGRSASYPAIPNSFSQELPILYESIFMDEYGFLRDDQFAIRVNCAFYDLSRDRQQFLVDHGIDNDPYNVNRDFQVSRKERIKEIRFGDFSQSLNSHFIFKNFKFYTNDAVPPFNLQEILATNFPNAKALNAHNVKVNNYGDVWFVGTCGMFFYISGSRNLFVGGTQTEVDNGEVDLQCPTGNVKSITFDQHNYMFTSNNEGIYYSKEHIKGFSQLLPISATALSVDKNNDLFVGTASGLIIYEMEDTSTGITVVVKEVIDAFPTEYVTSIAVDDNNIVWIGTYEGLYRYYKGKFLKFTTKNDLPSDRINDISIRNTAIRYLATANGIAKMMGSEVDEVITSENGDIYNNNIKCIFWQEPNVLWAGTMSKVNQILTNDIDGTYSTLLYEPDPSYVVKKDDLQVYYILPEQDHNIEEEDIVEVYINGNQVPYGYNIGFDPTVDQKVIRFDNPLKHDDVVEIIVRKDLKLLSTFSQTTDEKQAIGSRLVRIQDLDVAGDFIYLVSRGDENEVKINDRNSLLPFDRVHLDTIPPTGTIQIVEQVEKSIVKVNVTGNDGEDGSGVESMIISNYQNFTTDGEVAQTPVPFELVVNHDLGLTLEDVVVQLQFPEPAVGSKITYFSDVGEIYAATSLPAVLYKYDNAEQEWNILFSYEEDEYIDFIVKYNNRLLVSVGHAINVAKIYVYNYIFDNNGVFQSFSSAGLIAITESRAFSAYELNTLLYIGSGAGEGNEYSLGTAPNGGKLYKYDGSVLIEILSNIDDNIYDLTNSIGNDNLITVTGESGFVYEIDPINEIAFPVYNNVEPLVSVEFINYNQTGLIFAGGENRGTIRRSTVDSNSYDISFQTIPGKVSALKVFTIDDQEVLYAAVGNVVYYLSTSGTWVWRYTHSEYN